MNKKKYKVLAIIGEAGSGKDTLMQRVLTENPNLHEIISCTTRPPREGEVDGVNYYFLTIDQFTQKVLDKEMLEATCFNNWFYGTAYDSLSETQVNIGVFNPDGIDSMMAYGTLEIVCYYVRASDKTRLLRQLQREEDPDVHEIIRRFKADYEDFLEIDFHYNELINETAEDLEFNTKVVSAAVQRLAARIG